MAQDNNNVLVTIAFSHFNERARWALDWAGVPYHEVRRLPGFHVPAVMKYNKLTNCKKTVDDNKISSPMSTPLLAILDADGKGGRAIQNSGLIVLYAESRRGSKPSLFPADPAELELCNQLCQRFHDEVGPALRTIVYADLFKLRWKSLKTYVQMASHNVGLGQTIGWTLMYPLVNIMLSRAFGISKPGYVQLKRDQVAKACCCFNLQQRR